MYTMLSGFCWVQVIFPILRNDRTNAPTLESAAVVVAYCHA
jgi:hypothetical protein